MNFLVPWRCSDNLIISNRPLMIKRVVRDWLPRRHEIGFLQLESSTVSLPHSTDNISSPVLVLFQGKVLHTQSTREVEKRHNKHF